MHLAVPTTDLLHRKRHTIPPFRFSPSNSAPLSSPSARSSWSAIKAMTMTRNATSPTRSAPTAASPGSETEKAERGCVMMMTVRCARWEAVGECSSCRRMSRLGERRRGRRRVRERPRRRSGRRLCVASECARPAGSRLTEHEGMKEAVGATFAPESGRWYERIVSPGWPQFSMTISRSWRECRIPASLQKVVVRPRMICSGLQDVG